MEHVLGRSALFAITEVRVWPRRVDRPLRLEIRLVLRLRGCSLELLAHCGSLYLGNVSTQDRQGLGRYVVSKKAVEGAVNGEL